MAKNNPEIPAFPMIVTLKGLEHNTPWVQEMFSEQLAVGGEVEVRISRRRSLPQLRLYWSVLNLCVANSDNKYGRSEDLHDALKIALGYSRKVKVIGAPTRAKQIIDIVLSTLRTARGVIKKLLGADHVVLKAIDQSGKLVAELNDYIGETIVLPGSIAFGRMTQGDMNTFFTRAIAELSAAGYPADDYVREAEKSLASYKRPYQGKQVTGDSRGAEHKEAA